MTKFIKSKFTTGEVAMYEGKFVARFKYSGRGPFLTFLCKNFTVEEYFARLASGQLPLDILQSKGYISPTVKKVLLAAGYAPTAEGQKLYIEDQVQATLARRRAAA